MACFRMKTADVWKPIFETHLQKCADNVLSTETVYIGSVCLFHGCLFPEGFGIFGGVHVWNRFQSSTSPSIG